MRTTNGRAEILRAARDTFARKGFDGASIRDIAQEAGLSLSALYYYFPSKQDALYELIRDAYTWYIEHAQSVVEAAGDSVPDRVALLVRFIVRYRTRNTLISRVVLRDTERLDPERFDDIHGLQRASRAVLYDLIAVGRTDGTFPVVDAEIAGRAVLAITNAIPLWYREGGSITAATLEEQYVVYALRLLGWQEIDAPGTVERLLALPLAETGEVGYVAA
ncbi:TetR family transcriptional regulator [Brevibacterium samyangense]|uniref:TetR/AcrR family transcriptional regulator n=1 Tax=Brevibacterium samyangense TaxID=366888 RepID=A0ABP5ERQ5_9MICO